MGNIVTATHNDIAEVDSWDNYDRGTSRWDCLEHKIKLATPLSEKTINQLERKATRSWNDILAADTYILTTHFPFRLPFSL